MTMTQMTWSQWEQKYKPIRNPNNVGTGLSEHMFETFGEDLEYLKSAGIPNGYYWTLVDGGGVYLDIVSGVHWVDRLGYFITEYPWEEDVYVTNQK